VSLSVAVDGVSILDGIPPASIQCATAADLGRPAFGGFDVEDPAATLTITGHRPVTITESDCSQPRLFTGWTTTRLVGRDKDNAMVAGDQREHDVTIVDLNALFGFRMLVASECNRPAETWSERLTWLLGCQYLSDLIADTGSVITLTRAMDAADYRGSYPSAVLDDLSDRMSRPLNYFAFWDTTAATVGLFFDYADAAVNDSTLRISNDLADVDGALTFEPDSVARLSREPDQTYSEVVLWYAHGTKKVFRQRGTTADAYIRRGTRIERPYTGSQATALTQASDFLDQHATEQDRITATITVPPSAAGLVTAGQRMDVKLTHVPGYSTFISMRVISCTVSPTDDSLGRYAIVLELLSPRPALADVEELPTLEVAVIGDGTDVMAYGNTYDGGVDQSPPFTVQSSITVTGGHWYRTYFEAIGTCFPSGGGCYPLSTEIFFGTYQAGQFNAEPPEARVASPEIAPPCYGVGFVGKGTGSLDTAQGYVGNATVGQDVEAYLGFAANTGAQLATVQIWVEDLGLGDVNGPFNTPPPPVTPWDPPAADTTGTLPPAAGFTVLAETPAPAPDGTTVLFTLDYPYLSGSILVYVDGIPIPVAEVTETNPSAGTFTLSWAPDAGEAIIVQYVVG